MREAALRLILLLSLASVFAAHPLAMAQIAAPIASPAPDPVYEGQKAAFDALAEADRKAVQDALVWSGLYVGVVDGAFGKRTRDALFAYQTNVKASANGLIDAAQVAAMKAAAQKSRAAVGFQTVNDEKSGVSIGAPLKILDKRTTVGADLRLMKADGTVKLDLHSGRGEANMAALYARLSADAPGRKITYKATRPEAFFVVSGEEAGKKFYTRFAKAPTNWPDPNALRGFTFAYPLTQASALDRIALAVANSFEPFAAAIATKSPTAAAGAPTPPPTPAATPAPSAPFLGAAALVIAPGQALSALAASDCPNAVIDGKPAKFLREDKKTGLALLGGEFGAGASAPSFGELASDLIALSYVAAPPKGNLTLQVTAASPLVTAANRPSLLASLADGASGSPVFDRSGALVALVAHLKEGQKLVAGVAPLAPHEAISADEIREFLAIEAAPKAAGALSLSAGQIAAEKRGAIVAIICRR